MFSGESSGAFMPVFSRLPRRKALADPFAGSSSNGDWISDLLKSGEMETVSLAADHSSPKEVKVTARAGQTVLQTVPQQITFEEEIFNSLVQLKVAVATYAMHLPAAERQRIFDRLDAVINIEDWHEEDPLPIVESFKGFLKYLVYSNSFDWSSIGVSREGTILVAWSRAHVAITASFARTGRVTWTARVEPEEEGDEPDHAAGISSPQGFAEQARFYLSDRGRHGGYEHP